MTREIFRDSSASPADLPNLTRLCTQSNGTSSATPNLDGTFDFVCSVETPDAVSGGSTPQPSVNPDIPDTPPVTNLDSPDPAPAGAPGPFVSARKTGNGIINYIDADGRDYIRQGGSRAWRNYNPGNIRKGDFSTNHGAIGDDGAFAIFPDEKTGFDAIVALLRTSSYGSLDLEGAIERYAPRSENDTTSYVNFVSSETALAPNGPLLEKLKLSEIRKIARAIKKMEGWQPGTEKENLPASGIASGAASGVSSATAATTDWMKVAEREAALPARERSEWVDPEENPRILEYFRIAAPWFENQGDETDWCAAFVNYCLAESGHIGTNHPGARSFFWNKKKQFIAHSTPVIGSIAVRRYAPFSDSKWKTGRGHVGFVTAFDNTHVTLLGGNQSNTVRLTRYPLEVLDASGNVESKFVAFMMPVMN